MAKKTVEKEELAEVEVLSESTTAVAKREGGSVAAVQHSESLLQIIDRASRDESVDMDKMERLLVMYDKIQSKQAEVEFSVSMNAAQAEIGRITANQTNRHTNSKYADYAQIDRVIRPIYSKHGFSLSFTTGEATVDQIVVVCTVRHSGGHFEVHSVPMPRDGKGASGGSVMTKTHATGSAMHYGQRYLVRWIFNLAIGQDDNDGNPVEPVSGGQAESLRKSLRKAGLDEASTLMEWVGVESAADVPAIEFTNIMRRIGQEKADNNKDPRKVLIGKEVSEETADWFIAKVGEKNVPDAGNVVWREAKKVGNPSAFLEWACGSDQSLGNTEEIGHAVSLWADHLENEAIQSEGQTTLL